MALTRSASGPGLSINTNSANSLFGSGATSASGGMFGSTQASKPGGLFGSATTATTSAGGLFGSGTTAPATGGLFGSAPAKPAGGLFGSTPAATTQPASGGLFGSAPASTQPASGGLFGAAAATSQPASGGLFGASTATSQPASGGLFGTSTATSQPATGGLFGSSTTTTTQPATGGLFGQPAAQGQQGGGMFGNSTTTAAGGGGGLFGSLNQPAQNKGTLCGGAGVGNPSIAFNATTGTTQRGPLGASTTQQQTVPGVRIDVSNIRGTTRFEDLHEELKSEIQKLDDMILTQISFHQQCQAFMDPHEAALKQVPYDVEFCRRKLIGMENGQDSDVQSIAIAAQLVRQDADHATLSFRAIDNLKLPPQYHNTGMWHSNNEKRDKNDEDTQDIIGFFNKTADDLDATLNKYQGHITEIEQHLRGVEAASAQQINALVARKHGSSRSQSNPVEDLTAVLTDFESSLFGVADKVGGARAALREAQTDGFGEPQRNGYSASVNGQRRGIY